MEILLMTLPSSFRSAVSDKCNQFLSISFSGLLIMAVVAIIIPSCVRSDKAQRLEVAPRPYTVSYAPADGSVSPVDPPAFVWLPVEKSKEYLLQYSRKSDFVSDKTTSISCTRTIYVPRKVLGPGKWYWRFAITDTITGEKVFSRSRAFNIAEDAAPVPFPDVKSVISNLKGVRPRDFVRDDDIKRYRSLGTGPLRGYLTELKKDCEIYINESMLPEPVYPNDSRQRMIHRPFNAGMFACASVYLLTGDEKYGREARRRLMHIASWDPNGSTSLFHNDEAGSEIIRVMSRTYDWIYPILSEDDKKKIRDILAIRIPQLYKMLNDKPFEIHPYESHAMDYYIGDLLESSICMAGELPVEESLEYVLMQLWSPFFPPYGGDDGGWSEGPGYWQWSTATFLRDFTLIKQNCGVDLTKKPWLQNTLYFKLYCNPPYAKMSPFGDTQTEGVKISTQPRISLYSNMTDIMYKLGVIMNNPYALWYADQIESKPFGLERFIYYITGDDRGKPPTDIPQGRCFYNIGLACMHSDLANGANNVYFLLRSCPFGSISHSYADQNAFVLFAYGEPLAIASGYYNGYGSPHHSKWTWETKASNSLLVDGQGQNTRNWDARGRIINFTSTDYAHYALGDATEAYGGRLTRFFRHSLFLRPTIPGDEPVIVLFDDIISPKPSTYDWLLHSLEKMQINDSAMTVNIKRGAARLKVQFLNPKGLKFSQTDKFTVSPERENLPNQWHLNAQSSSPSSKAQFITVLMPYREGQEDKLPQIKLIDKPGWMVVEINGAATRQIVAFRTDAKPGSTLNLENFSTKADVAASAFDLQGKTRLSIEVMGK